MTEPTNTDAETQDGSQHETVVYYAVEAYEIFAASGRTGLALWLAAAPDSQDRRLRKHAAFAYMYGCSAGERRQLFAKRFEQ
jgi:hypothetical protein